MNENKKTPPALKALFGDQIEFRETSLKECAGIFDIKKTSFREKDIVRFEGITKEGKNILSYLINNLDIKAIEISTADGYSLEHEIKKGYDVLIQKVEVD